MVSTTDCGAVGQYGGTCSTGTSQGDHVDIGATEGGGGQGSGGDGQSEAGGDSSGTGGDTQGIPNALNCRGIGVCVGELVVNPDQPPAPAVAISDLASFYPQKPSVAGEPNGWAVIGLDTNFVASATEHTASGTLLGQAATVRFRPEGFVWRYGDGDARTTAAGGATWKDLGVAEFTPTATSHVYDERGSYRVELTVEYSAQYRIGAGPWLGVAGTLRLSAPTSTVIAADAKTVLVQRNCAIDPRGPGC